ncbi:MAG: 3-oxoacyl-ACP reductase FabG [Armatimonadetes bacterium]|nr:3-oxoacyl-ACP reductase FabG [Armatimonadota bacterium]
MKQRTALVTGGSRGIGSACAHALAAAGARVLVASRKLLDGQAVVDQIRGKGGTADAISCDVADRDSVAAMAARARDLTGGVDILVNNAGIATSGPLHRLALEEWNRVMQVNSTGTFLCTQALLAGMLERGWGRVINMASVAGMVGGGYITAYCASKHAVLGFTRALAQEVARRGVTVNAVCPGFVETDMTEESLDRICDKTGRTREAALAALVAESPQGRLIQPDEVAYLVACLADELAGSINGQCIAIDGGMVAR